MSWELWESDYTAYRKYVTDTLAASCQTAWLSHAAQHSTDNDVPYLSVASHLGGVLHQHVVHQLPWDVQIGLLSWCRMRAGYVLLHTGSGQGKSCVFCARGVRNAYVHVLEVCPHWSRERDLVLVHLRHLDMSVRGRLTRFMLGCDVEERCFIDVVRFASGIDR